jgi:hypothetical protein
LSSCACSSHIRDRLRFSGFGTQAGISCLVELCEPRFAIGRDRNEPYRLANSVLDGIVRAPQERSTFDRRLAFLVDEGRGFRIEGGLLRKCERRGNGGCAKRD